VDAIKSAVDKVATASQALGAAMYAAGGSAAAGADPNFGGPEQGDDDIVDAEVIDEDERK
jgi:molecular chaperone DnaK